MRELSSLCAPSREWGFKIKQEKEIEIKQEKLLVCAPLGEGMDAQAGMQGFGSPAGQGG